MLPFTNLAYKSGKLFLVKSTDNLSAYVLPSAKIHPYGLSILTLVNQSPIVPKTIGSSSSGTNHNWSSVCSIS